MKQKIGINLNKNIDKKKLIKDKVKLLKYNLNELKLLIEDDLIEQMDGKKFHPLLNNIKNIDNFLDSIEIDKKFGDNEKILTINNNEINIKLLLTEEINVLKNVNIKNYFDLHQTFFLSNYIDLPIGNGIGIEIDFYDDIDGEYCSLSLYKKNGNGLEKLDKNDIEIFKKIEEEEGVKIFIGNIVDEESGYYESNIDFKILDLYDLSKIVYKLMLKYNKNG